ncbi:hypothetical protein Tco_1271386, partial [Tanacetum coccineum]
MVAVVHRNNTPCGDKTIPDIPPGGGGGMMSRWWWHEDGDGIMMMMTGVARDDECIGDPIDRPVSHLFAFAGKIPPEKYSGGGRRWRPAAAWWLAGRRG